MKLDNPPVVERVFTLQFMPLPGFDLIHIGLWFEKIRDRFPVFSRQQLLGHITESFPFRHEVSRLRCRKSLDVCLLRMTAIMAACISFSRIDSQ
jgi:hypothetical protein